MEFRAPLPDDDRARGDELPGEALHAEVLGPGVAAVAGGTDTLLVCHASVTQSLSLTSAIFTSVNGCRCPAWRRYPLRRANRSILIFSPLPWRTTSAVTLAPFTTGFPACTCLPSLASSTRSNVTLLPGSASSSGTLMVTPGSARNWAPPVVKMA